LLHGRGVEARLTAALEALGVKIKPSTERQDLFGAVDAIVTGYRPGPFYIEGSSFTPRPRPMRHIRRPIYLQYTLKVDDAEKLRRFVGIAKRRSGKHLYVMLDLKGEPAHRVDLNDPRFFVLAQMLREVIFYVAHGRRNPDALWVVILKSRTGFFGDSDGWQEQYELDVQTPERMIDRIEQRLERRLMSQSRQSGEIKWVNRTGGRIGFHDPDGSKQYLMFDREAVRDPKLQQVISQLLRLERGRELNGLRVSFEVQNTSDGPIACSVLVDDPDKMEKFRALIWEETVVKPGRLKAALEEAVTMT